MLLEVLCLLGKGPLAFLLFCGAGGVVFLAGILLYLQTLLSASSQQAARQQDDTRL